MKKRKTPDIRFKGFTDAWEQRKLGELSIKTYGGGTPKTSIEEYWQGDIPWIQSSDIVEDQVLQVSPRKFITTNAIKHSAAKLIPENSVAVITRVGVGKLAIIPFSYTTSQDFLSFSQLKIDHLYFTYSLYRMLKANVHAVQGTSIKGITKEELLSRSIFVPINEKEQHEIGMFFKTIDNLITLRQRKLEKLKKLKKSLLQRMFPENGCAKPELRFAGFTDVWKQRKLGDLGSLKNGMNFSKESMGIGFPFVNLQNIFGRNEIDVGNLGKAEANDKELKEYNLKKGDVLFVRSSVKLEGVGEAALVPQDIDNTTYSGFIIRFRDEFGLSDNFKKFIFSTKTIRDQIISRATNSANKNISQTVLANLELLIPFFEEQKQIGEFLSQMDNLITLHQRELEMLKRVKKALLDKMFV